MSWTVLVALKYPYSVGMKCPACDSDGVYIGLQWIHCRNETCRHYDPVYTKKVMFEEARAKFHGSVDQLLTLREQNDLKFIDELSGP